MEFLSVVSDKFGIERPKTAMFSREKKTLGSACPVIIKHEFPNEQKNYIDNLGQELSSAKKRFIYDRPFTAKVNKSGSQNGLVGQNNCDMKRSQSIQNMSMGGTIGLKKHPSSAQIKNNNAIGSYQLNSAELYNKLLDGQKIRKESRFVIKPARKLNTMQIHSALFKIKKQKEDLDGKIRDLEDLKTNFNEMDFYLIANSGAVDYMFNAGANDEISPPFLSITNESDEGSENRINSLSNIKGPPSKYEVLSSSKNVLKNKNRPQTSGAKLAGTTVKAIKKERARTAKADSRDQIEMLKNEDSHDTANGVTADLEILGNCVRFFQHNERSQVQDWGHNMNQQDQIKDAIDQIGHNLPIINNLLSPKQIVIPVQNGNANIGEIKEEEDDEEIQFLAFDSINGQQNGGYKNGEQTGRQQNNFTAVSPNQMYPDNNYQGQFASAQGERTGKQQQQDMRAFFSNQVDDMEIQHPIKQINSQIQQNRLGIYPSFQKKQALKNNQKRVMSATSGNGLNRPLSSSKSGLTHGRPMTALNNTTSNHTLNYGPVQVMKERVSRNFDHLHILQDMKDHEKRKLQKDNEKKENLLSQQSLQISGHRLPVNQEDLIELIKQTQEALFKFNQSQQMLSFQPNEQTNQQQVSLLNNNFFSNNNKNNNEPQFLNANPTIDKKKGMNQKTPLNYQSLPIQNHQISLPYPQSEHNKYPFFQDNDPTVLPIQNKMGLNINNNHQIGVSSTGSYSLNISQSQQMPEQMQELQRLSQLHSTQTVEAASQQEYSSNQINRAPIDLLQMHKDQNMKRNRPNTAKHPPQWQNQHLQQGQNNNPLLGIGVPVSESLAVKFPISSLITSGETAYINQFHSKDQSGADRGNNSINLNPNVDFDGLQSMQMVVSKSAQPPNNSSIPRLNRLSEDENDDQDEQTIKRKNIRPQTASHNRPQTAIKK